MALHNDGIGSNHNFKSFVSSKQFSVCTISANIYKFDLNSKWLMALKACFSRAKPSTVFWSKWPPLTSFLSASIREEVNQSWTCESTLRQCFIQCNVHIWFADENESKMIRQEGRKKEIYSVINVKRTDAILHHSRSRNN